MNEPSCPFCHTGLDLGATPPPALPTRRLGRAALFAFGATLAATLGTGACGGQSESDSGGQGNTGGSGGNAGGAAGEAANGGSGNVMPMYGVAADAGLDPDAASGGAAGSAGQSAGGFAGTADLYGVPPDPDDS